MLNEDEQPIQDKPESLEKGPGASDTVGSDETAQTTSKKIHNRQPSLSLQSQLRSSSFRRTSVSQAPTSPPLNGGRSPNLPVLSPEGDSLNEIYRKQASRLDELEKENRRLAKDARENEARWKKTEEELEELRESNGEVAELKLRAGKVDAKSEEIEKLVRLRPSGCDFMRFHAIFKNEGLMMHKKNENTSLQRQIAQLQSQSFRSTRHASSPSQAQVSIPASELQARLDSKSSTVESMEIEISNLRSQLDKSLPVIESHRGHVAALEEKLDRAERAAGAAQRELLDVKKNLDRASEKAVMEGSERTSAETKIRSLGREADDSKKLAEDSLKKVETLEKKLTTLTTLHKESDGRRQVGERERERVEKEATELKRRLAAVENENLRLMEERERLRKREAGGVDDEGVDELEDEERGRLEDKVRRLESEVFDLRRGVWKDRRRNLAGTEGEDGSLSPGSKFDDIDLTGGSPLFRRQSLVASRGQAFTNVLSSGLNAITGGGRQESSQDLLDGMDDDGFDEDAFRIAQEEESRKRLERVREVKRRLKDWEGWRMDIVDCRIGSGGAGEIFDV